jgi:hypothetical protein
MANMSYCMMENTSIDLYDCLNKVKEYENVTEWVRGEEPSPYEVNGLMDLIETCKDIIAWKNGEL